MTVKIKLARANGALVSYPASAPTIVTNAVSELITQYSNTATVLQYDATTYANAVAYVDGKSYVNTSQLSSNLANYQTTAGLASNVAVLAANSAGFLGNSSGTIANVSSWITSNAGAAYTNAVSYVDGKAYVNTSQLSSNLANYQTTAGLSANVATLTSNNATYVYGKTEINLNVNNALTANSSTFLGTANLQNIQTFITSNAATAYSNSVSYVDGKAYVNTAQLSSNLANYQTTAGLAANVATLAANSATYANASISNTFTIGTATYFVANGNVGIGNTTPNAKLTVTGTANVSGNVVIGGALTSANLTTTTANIGSVIATSVAVGANVSLDNGNNGRLFVGNSTVNAVIRTTAIAIQSSDAVNSSAIFLVTELPGRSALSLSGNSGGYIDFKAPVNAAEYNQRIITNTSSISIIGGSSTTTANNILLMGANVGIGTATPDARLAVLGTANVSGNVTIGGALTSANLTTQNIGVGANIQLTTTQLFVGNSTVNTNYSATEVFIRDTTTSGFMNSSMMSVGSTIVNTSVVKVGSTTANNTLINTAAINVIGQVNAATINITGSAVIGGITTHNANVILGSSGLSANGGFGTAGQLLNSNGSATYWAADKATNAYSNAVSYVDGKSYVNTSQLSSNLANYALLTGATFSGNVRTQQSAQVDGNLVVSGNLTVTGNVVVIGANNLSVVDNMIYLNSNSVVTNPDLGFAGNYNDGVYRHTGFFRDASDGVWKVFDSYLPEPDASPYIDTTNTSFKIANFQANIVYVGNTTVYSTINTTSFSGTANNTTNAFGKTEGNLNVNNALTANSSTFLGTANLSNIQTFITSNAATAYTNAVAYVDGKSYVNTSQLSSNLANYQTTAGLASNVATLAANSATYANASISNTFTIGTSTYFVSNGNVGIGTNAPAGLLHLKSIGPIELILEADSDNITESDNPRIIMKQDGGAVVGRIGYANNTNDLEVISEHPGSLHLGTANTIRITADAGGNVGIGTTTPNATLAITGTANVSGNVTIGSTLTSANLIVSNLATVGSNVQIGTNGLVLGNSTVNSAYLSGILAFSRTVGANVGAIDISTTPTGLAYLELGGTTGAYIDFKVPFSDDYDQRIEANSSSISIIGGSSTSAANNILLSAANVGIGTTTPDARLAVVGTANVSGNMTIGGSLTTSNVITVGTSTYFVSNGNVGIGTNGPFYKFQINGGTLGSTLGSTVNTFSIYSSTGNADYINFSKVRQAVGSDWTTAAWRIQQVVDATSQGYIQFNGNGLTQGVSFGTTNTERMRIDASGNVGIGNTAPNATLAITGTANVSGNVAIGGTTIISGNTTLSGALQTISGNVNIDAGLLFVDSINNRVGIGNTAPNATLAVTGTANVSGNVVIGGTLTTQSFVANTLGLYNTGTINAVSYTVGTAFIANTTNLFHNNLLLQGDGTNAYIRATTGVLFIGTGSTNYFAATAAGGGAFIPTTDNLYNLGSSTNRWANIYTGDLQLSNEGSDGNDIDHTTGSWTIQEGHENLYLINRKTGKKYMFVLKEV